MIVLDLEDAVAAGAKDSAREAVDAWLGAGADAVVRINDTETDWYSDDVAMVARHRCAVMLPKATSARQVASVAERFRSGTPMVALIETAAGVLAAQEICAVEAVTRAAFGSIDLAAELGVDPDAHEALQLARSTVVLASAATRTAAPFDGVTTAIKDGRLIVGDSARAARLGFGGKLCIHPSQVETVNHTFTPSDAEIAWARKITEAAAGSGARVVAGRMVDKPVIERAERIIARVNEFHRPEIRTG